MGRAPKEFLQGQVSNDVLALSPGTGCYATLLTPKGKMLADLRILDAEDELLLDTERVALQELFNVIRRFSLGYDVTLHKRTLECGLISLLGPQSARLAGAESLGAEEHAHAVIEVESIDVRAIRTEIGVDLLCDAAQTEALMAALVHAGAVAISDATADTVRIERGRPRYGVDLDDTVIPQEADLNGRAVSFTKGCYVGQETVARLYLPRQAEPASARAAAHHSGRLRVGDHVRRPRRRPPRLGGALAVARPGRAGARPARGAARLAGPRRT